MQSTPYRTENCYHTVVISKAKDLLNFYISTLVVCGQFGSKPASYFVGIGLKF